MQQHRSQDPMERFEAQQRRFEQLLREKREQDEQLAELYEAAGVDPEAPIDEEALQNVPEQIRALFEEDVAPVPPVSTPTASKPLQGFVVRG